MFEIIHILKKKILDFDRPWKILIVQRIDSAMIFIQEYSEYLMATEASTLPRILLKGFPKNLGKK